MPGEPARRIFFLHMNETWRFILFMTLLLAVGLLLPLALETA